RAWFCPFCLLQARQRWPPKRSKRLPRSKRQSKPWSRIWSCAFRCAASLDFSLFGAYSDRLQTEGFDNLRRDRVHGAVPGSDLQYGLDITLATAFIELAKLVHALQQRPF